MSFRAAITRSSSERSSRATRTKQTRSRSCFTAADTRGSRSEIWRAACVRWGCLIVFLARNARGGQSRVWSFAQQGAFTGSQDHGDLEFLAAANDGQIDAVAGPLALDRGQEV